MSQIINQPSSGSDVVIRDLVDAQGTVIVPGAIFRRETNYTFIGLNTTITQRTHAMLNLGNTLYPFLHKDEQYAHCWHVSYAGNPAALVRFRCIKLNTGFTLLSDGDRAIMLVPSFENGGVQKSLWWNAAIDLWMLLTPASTLLVCTRPQFDGALYKLPVPNVYENGTICMGREFYCDPDVKPHLDIERRLHHFMDSSWNSDLAPDLRRSQAIFRWNDREEQIDVTTDEVISNSTVIMNNELSAIILAAKAESC